MFWVVCQFIEFLLIWYINISTQLCTRVRMLRFNMTACFQSYGENCQHPCSQHCYNKNCDRFNGSCLTGCMDGFYGKRCDKGKQELKFCFNFRIAWNILFVNNSINLVDSITNLLIILFTEITFFIYSHKVLYLIFYF